MLKKKLGFLDVFSIASGAMISSGLFILPSIAFSEAGPAIVISYLLAGVLMIPTVFSKAELTTAMPKAGGTYFFVERALGQFFGTIAGFSNWFSISLKSAFALIGIGAFAKLFYPELTYNNIKLIAIGFVFIFAFINLMSVKTAGKFQVIFVLILLMILAGYCFIGYRFVEPSHYIPFMPNGLKSILSTAGLVFISYGGLTKVSSIGEEVSNPKKNIVWGMFTALVIVNIIYVLVVDITVGLLHPDVLKTTILPITEGAKVFAKNTGVIFLSLAGALAFITTANAGIMSASRTPFAMSRDGLLPEVLKKLSKKNLPHISIWLTSFFMIIMIAVFNLKDLVKLASTLMLLLFLLVNISLIMMRESRVVSYKPEFYSPMYPYLQILSIIVYGFLIVEMGTVSLIAGTVFLFISFLWYTFYVRKKVMRKSALMYIVERVVLSDKVFVSQTLEDELREILIERDEIVEDRFDSIIRKAKIIDISEEEKLEVLFKRVSSVIEERIGIDRNKIYKLLIERETKSSTVIAESLAVPHIIIEGENIFDILILRAKKGIVFSDNSIVNAIFVLSCSIDERNFYLRALTAIAQIAQEKDFMKNWMNAKNEEDLRNLLLLSSRKRS